VAAGVGVGVAEAADPPAAGSVSTLMIGVPTSTVCPSWTSRSATTPA
jgi:hypothetical protein